MARLTADPPATPDYGAIAERIEEQFRDLTIDEITGLLLITADRTTSPDDRVRLDNAVRILECALGEVSELAARIDKRKI